MNVQRIISTESVLSAEFTVPSSLNLVIRDSALPIGRTSNHLEKELKTSRQIALLILLVCPDRWYLG